MPAKCPPGYIRRAAYKRKSYTRADGTFVKGATVKSSCVPDKGKPGKTPKRLRVLPKPTKGNLSKYGYFDVKNLTAKQRHAALTKAVKDAGYATIIRRVNLVRNYNKLSDPRVHKIMSADIEWMQQKLAPIYSKTAKRKSKKRVSKRKSKRVSKKVSKKPVKAGQYIGKDGRKRQLYRLPGSRTTFYRYRKKDGGIGRRYV